MKRWSFWTVCRLSVLTLLLGVSLAGIVPQAATAAQLSWDPQWIDFGQVPIGSTAYQTLTLTNEDADIPISISGIEFTFNQGGAFTWNAAVPTEIPPGGFLEVELSFTAMDISFAMADMWIYNDSENASSPGLYIQLMGEGLMSDPCYPETNCSGSCVNLQIDIANCGSCGNVCDPPDHATATCTDGNCGFICDAGYEPSGDHCLPLDKTALELLEELVQFAQDSHYDGTLTGVALGNGDTKEYVLVHKFLPVLSLALEDLMLGRTKQTCNSLNFAQLRSDTGWPTIILPPDMVDGPARQEVYDRIIEVINKLEDCEPTEPIRPPSW